MAEDRPTVPATDQQGAEASAPASALPPVGARVLAFAAIVVGGLCGLVIGAAIVDVQCTGDCTVPSTIGAVVGGVVGALGVAVVAVLALRAMGEWRTIEHGAAARREYVQQAEDARGVSLLGRMRGDDQPPPPELPESNVGGLPPPEGR